MSYSALLFCNFPSHFLSLLHSLILIIFPLFSSPFLSHIVQYTLKPDRIRTKSTRTNHTIKINLQIRAVWVSKAQYSTEQNKNSVRLEITLRNNTVRELSCSIMLQYLRLLPWSVIITLIVTWSIPSKAREISTERNSTDVIKETDYYKSCP